MQTDKGQNLWAVTETGRNYLEEHKQLTESVTESVPQESVTGTAQKPQPEVTIPSQSDLFKCMGERLRTSSLVVLLQPGYRLKGIADVTTVGAFVRDVAHSDRPLCVQAPYLSCIRPWIAACLVVHTTGESSMSVCMSERSARAASPI